MKHCPIFLLIVLALLDIHAQTDTLTLNNWRFSCLDPADTNYTLSGGATVPGCIHTDLRSHGLIPSPFYGTNEDSLQWISDVPVTYTCEIWRDDLKQKKNLELIFESVTGYAEVFLNGKPLNHNQGNNVIDNAYRTWHFSLDGRLYAYNILEIKFTPARRIIEQRKSEVPYALPDDRVLLRTPPYQAGWDWGPKLTTCGITGNVYILQKGNLQVSEIVVTPVMSSQAPYVRVCTSIKVTKPQKVHYECLFDGKRVKSCDTKIQDEEQIFSTYQPNEIKLWYPNGMGEQELHEVVIVLKYGKYADTIRRRIGLRTIELRQQNDSIGQSFEFIVNGQSTFMKGVNWIPADFFPTEMTETRYRELLQACKDANMNMIRVWGGGIYEPDIFYDLCDEMGILVWQDFMYACALYPWNEAFKQNAHAEAREQIIRLSEHPCIATWCGNNEVKNGWDDWGWQNDYTPAQRDTIADDIHNLFDLMLKNDVENNTFLQTPYVSTSPLWGWGHPECCTEGDSHYWGVWWGEQPFEMYIPKTGRFMSEFGFQSYPDIRTLKTVVPENELHLGSPAMNNHQKHARGVQIINKAMKEYFYLPDNLEDYIYISQLVQAYGTGLALQEHRRRMPYCMGSLFWQLNDCWPVASWSCIDYYGRRKALYYEAKRDFAPVIITTDTLRNDTLPIFIVNDLQTSQQGNLQMNVCNFNGEILQSQTIENVNISQNSSQFTTHFILKDENKTQCYLHFILTDKNGKKITEKVHFLVVPGKLKLPHSPIKVTQKGDEIQCVSSTLQYGVELISDVDGTFSDNFFILLPGVEKVVKFTPKDDSVGNIRVRSLTQR